MIRILVCLCLCLCAALPASAQSVLPATITLGPGQTQQFTATCPTATPGCNIHDWAIDSPTSTWTCSADESNAGSIDQTGLYTAPAIITTTQTVHINLSVGDMFTGCRVTVTLQPSPLPPPPPGPVPTTVLPWSLGWGLIWGPSGNGTVPISVDPTQVPGISISLPVLGSPCTGMQFADAVTELRVCLGGKWGRITGISFQLGNVSVMATQ